jgi:Transglycosylase SLT domain
VPGPLDAYDPVFEAAGKEWNVDPTLLKAMATQESGGRANAVSRAGAQGVMQIMPGTQRQLGVTDPNDPVQSIWGGAKYMSQALDAEGNPEDALRYYHGGPGWRQLYGTESQHYVPSVVAHYQALQAARAAALGGALVASPAQAQAPPPPQNSSIPPPVSGIVAPDGGIIPPNPYARPGQPILGPMPQGAPATATIPMPNPSPPVPAPVATTPPRPPLILGDSLASRQGLGGQGVVGASPQAVLAQIDGLLPEQIAGRRVILSSGASNNPAQAQMLGDQLDRLRSRGAGGVTVLGVGNRGDFGAAGVNAQLGEIARQSGARFVPLDPRLLSRDGVHPTAQGYQVMRQRLGLP